MKQKQTSAATKPARTRPRIPERLRENGRLFRRDWQLHLLILLPVLYLIIFHYVPMYGAQIAFRDYRPKLGIMGSEWVGLKWFKKFLTNYNFQQILSNTVIVSLYDILVGFPLPILLALLLNTIKSEKFKKFTQSVTYIPHFISVVVLIAMFNQIFSPMNGLYGTLYRLLGGAGYPRDFRTVAESFRHIYVWTGVWQDLGWNTIIYTAALSAVSQEHHEAAQIDGITDIGYLLKVVLPLSKSILAVITLYYAVSHWNSYFNAMLYLRDESLYPLQLVLRSILNSGKVDLSQITDVDIIKQMRGLSDLMKYSLIIISSAPIIIAYPFVQKFFEKGVIIGSVKG